MKIAKNIFSIVLCFSLIAGVGLNISSYASGENYVNENATKLFEIPVKPGEGSLVYSDFGVGPQSFTVTSNNIFYVLDTEDHQIEKYDVNGKYLSTINLPENGRWYYDITSSTNNRLYVLDDLGGVLEYQHDKLINEYEYPHMKKTDAIGLFVNENGSAVLRGLEGEEIQLETRINKSGFGKYTRDHNGKNIILRSTEHTIEVQYKYQPAGTFPIQKINRHQFVIENEALIGKSIYLETRIGKYLGAQKVSSAIAIPFDKYTPEVQPPHDHVSLSSNGKAYQMVFQADSVIFMEIHFNDKASNIDANIVNRIEPGELITKEGKDENQVSIAAVSSASDAFSRAFDLAHLDYKYYPTYHETPSTSTTTPPSYLAAYDPTYDDEYWLETGIPYTWGGFDGADTAHSWVSWTDFNDGLDFSHNATVGNINTNSPGWVSGTIGLDCSGFISSAYDLGQKYGTSGLATTSYFTDINFEDMQKGDIAIRLTGFPHVFMFDSWKITNYTEIIGVFTYEATTDGSEDKTKLWDRDLSNAQQFTYVRTYNN